MAFYDMSLRFRPQNCGQRFVKSRAKRDTNPGVDLHGKEVVNFQISMSIYMLLAGLSMFIVIGFFLLPAVILTNLVLIIIASVKASRGELYRYPLTIRFIN